jgi:S1-C subfamily serine protease
VVFPPEPDRASERRPSKLVLLLLTILSIWLLFQFVPYRFFRPAAEPRAVTPRGALADEEKTNIEIFQAASPAVVYITSVAVRSDRFGFDITEIPAGTGSGFLWDAEGHVVTNFHVIQNADAVRVTLHDQSNWRARLVGGEPDKDIAVLRIDAPATRLRPIAIGTSRDLQVGQRVYAIGNPFGLDQTLTTGIVSALGRSMEAMNGRTIQDVIQTDAAINPGNSGGPLLDSAGRLIGVNTAIYSPSGVSAGIGFAVPVDIVNRVVPELIQYGRVTRPQLGIVAFPDGLAARLGIEGVLIREVEEGSGAAAAGLRGTHRTDTGDVMLGDVIQAIDDAKTASMDDLLNALERRKSGDSVTVTFERDGQARAATVQLK